MKEVISINQHRGIDTITNVALFNTYLPGHTDADAQESIAFSLSAFPSAARGRAMYSGIVILMRNSYGRNHSATWTFHADTYTGKSARDVWRELWRMYRRALRCDIFVPHGMKKELK